MHCDYCSPVNGAHETRTFRCRRCEVVRWLPDGAPLYVLGVLLGYLCHECPREPQERSTGARKAVRATAAVAAAAGATAAPVTTATAAPMVEG